ncbi:MAG: hypothetical protein KC464_23700, partial [Myxococcales bacterium]|nr:hypothetical protein [Myxococcales bacterium]
MPSASWSRRVSAGPLALVLVLIPACGSSAGNGGGDGGTIADGPVTSDAFTGPFDDFPAQPIIDTDGGATTPGDAPGLFGDPGSGSATGGPCLVEPEVGTLYPRNWLRPRFSWLPAGGQNLFELRVETAAEANPLIVYTTATSWTMPAGLWSGLTAHAVDVPITVTVRGAVWDGTVLTDGPARGSTGDIAIAPVAAPGTIVYWTTIGGSALRGFRVGDEGVQDIVRPADAGTACVGCHASTPDGA